jgi:hypothetical protein
MRLIGLAVVLVPDDSAVSAAAGRPSNRMMDRRAFITIVGGGILAGPLAIEGQQPSMIPMIGYLSARSPEDTSHLVAAFRGGLSQEGFVEGQNVTIEYRWALAIMAGCRRWRRTLSVGPSASSPRLAVNLP